MAVLRLREQKKSATRAALILAAERVVEERGFMGASVDAIVQAAGLTKGALYSNFADKDDLLVEVLRRQIRAAQPAGGDAFADLTVPGMIRVFAGDLAKVADADVSRSLDVQQWMLKSPRARAAQLPEMLAGVARAADWFARQDHPLPVTPLDEVVLQAGLVLGLAYLRAILGRGAVRDDLAGVGAALLAGVPPES